MIGLEEAQRQVTFPALKCYTILLKGDEFMSRGIAFDTLQHAKQLEAAGFTPQQAEAQTKMFAEIIDDKIATKHDLKEMKLQLQKEMIAGQASMVRWVIGVGVVQAALIMSFITLIKFLH